MAMDQSNSRAESIIESAPQTRIGSYRLLELLGTGGMSSVYRAMHVETGHEVALKILTQSLARNSTLLQRFLREARSAETLEHPNVVAIYDRGIDKGRHYLVLEYVPGGDFHDYVQRHGPLGAAEAISVIRGVASGLKYAASRGLIHRDIKPSNILRTKDGHAKIIDLGLALQSEFEDERVTREGTTVGTVDYMAPEQARDSRATSVQSDLYSLGCTFYYLLSGVPPYPGGDITDKLTRHARSAVPDIRDLRPDLPAILAELLARLMAKRQEDRTADYDELIAALDAVPVDPAEEGPGIALAPLDSGTDDDRPATFGPTWASRPAAELPKLPSEDAFLPLEPLGSLVAEAADEVRAAPVTAGADAAGAPLPRLSGALEEVDSRRAADDPRVATTLPSRSQRSASAWIISASVIAIALVLTVIGVHQLLIGPAGPAVVERDDGDLEVPINVQPVIPAPAPAPAPSPSAALASTPVDVRSLRPDQRLPEPARSQGARRKPWVEPRDDDPVPGQGNEEASGLEDLRLRAPQWARTPVVDRLDGPFVVVRRVGEPGDGSTVVPTLHMALDRYIGGTVELADEGPLPIDDLRVSGMSRLIRARPGFRPIIRIERSNLELARQQPAVLVLDRKDLTLDGLDIVVNVRDLSMRETALFACTASNLTLRNCTITILNPGGSPFSVIRAESTGPRPARIRLERTLVRGWFTSGLEIGGGQTELLVYRSVLLGGTGPTVRISRRESGSEHRFDFVDAVIAGPGPVLEQTVEIAATRVKPLVIQAFGSAFGRFQGRGVASVIASSSASAEVGKELEWSGDRNLFAGWRGFFACGSDRNITVGDLAAVRSTWSGTDQGSHEILAPWPLPADLAAATPEVLAWFLPNRTALLNQVARPRSGLFEKTVAEYRAPAIPEPIGWAVDSRFVTRATRARPTFRGPDRQAGGPRVPPAPNEVSGGPPGATGGVVELTMSTSDSAWNGDLGAFLQDRLSAGMTHVRVSVEGQGWHHFTPVRLPSGLHLQIRVEAQGDVQPPEWSPVPGSTGPALIELHEGSLVLWKVVLRQSPDSRLESLISVEDGHLVVSGCQLSAPAPSTNVTGRLITFRATTTEPKPADPTQPIFTIPVDRPVCRIIDSILIASGMALRAELGRGLVAITQSAIAAGDAALQLVPAQVARQRFDVDLSLGQCTILSERSVVSLGSWPGRPLGPDRPWLVTSRNCAFLALSDRRGRGETVLLRADSDALARGTLFWESANDAAEVDSFTAAGEAPAPPNRMRDVQLQWAHFWGANHITRITGPRNRDPAPSVVLWERPRPGRLEPADLILDPSYHPGRERLDVGADLSRQGITPRTNRSGQRRN
jgi:serine/threonine-protein kinase